MSEQTVEQTVTPGRPSKYTPQNVGKILGALQAGLSIESACEYIEIDPDTHYEWIKRYPEYSEKVISAKMYGKLLASKQVTDILQDIAREEGSIKDKNGNIVKPKYSEAIRANIAWKYLEKHERGIYGSQSMLAAKTETNDKGGTTTTLIYATDNQLEQLLKHLSTTDTIDGEYANGHTEEDSQTASRPPEDSAGQLPQIPAPSSQA